MNTRRTCFWLFFMDHGLIDNKYWQRDFKTQVIIMKSLKAIEAKPQYDSFRFHVFAQFIVIAFGLQESDLISFAKK